MADSGSWESTDETADKVVCYDSDSMHKVYVFVMVSSILLNFMPSVQTVCLFLIFHVQHTELASTRVNVF